MAKSHKEVMLVESDIECPARKWFEKERPNQYVNTGVAEQNAVSICGGLSSKGFVPYWYTFGFLIGRAYDQIRQSVAVDKRDVKIFGYNCCVSGVGGRSHNCVDDIGLMRLIPNMTVVAPADEYELYKAVEESYKTNGSVYVRFGRGSVPAITEKEAGFNIGESTTEFIGNSYTVFIACGSMVGVARELAEEFDATVINMSTIKPIDVSTIRRIPTMYNKVVTMEEGYINGGLADAVSQHITVDLRIGVDDRWMQSGKGDLKSHYGLDVNSVRKRLKQVCC